jgi:predicted DNA-binding transcriptional regulator AlpA
LIKTKSPPPGTTLLTLEEVAEATGLSESTIHRQAMVGSFPMPYRTSPNSGAWDSSEIELFNDLSKRPRQPAVDGVLDLGVFGDMGNLLDRMSADELGYPDLYTAPVEDPAGTSTDESSEDDRIDF